MSTADKPDLPIPAWARDFHGEAAVVTHMECAAHANAIEAWARADERRKALESLAQEFDAMGYRGSAATARRMIDRQEPTI